LRLGQPRDLATDQVRGGEQVIHDAVGGQQKSPEDGDDRDREQPRQDVDHSEEGLGPVPQQIRVEQEREDQADDQVRDHARAGEDEGVPDRAVETVAGQNVDVVREPDELRVLLHDDVVHQRVAQNHDDRDQHQDDHQDHRRGDVPVGRQFPRDLGPLARGASRGFRNCRSDGHEVLLSW